MQGMLPIDKLQGVDWDNPDVKKVFEFFSEQFGVSNSNHDEEIQRLKAQADEEIQRLKAQADEEIQRLNEKIEELTKLIDHLQRTRGGRGSRKARSYNTREFKDYPRTEDTSQKPSRFGIESEKFETVHDLADPECCPSCGADLAESSSSHVRNSCEDVRDGKWCNVHVKVLGRYCKNCRKIIRGEPMNFLPSAHLGINVLAIIYVMRHFVVSYKKIRKIISMIYGRNLPVSTIMKADELVSEKMRPVYDDLLASLGDASVIGGDETGWYVNGTQYWTWVFQADSIVVYHIAHSRSKMVSETFLPDFEGITVGDSHPAWNAVGKELQKCLLHYFRDMHRTLERNKSAEFTAFFTELHSILKSAIRLGDKHESVADIPKGSITRLQNRIDALASKKYEDTDCSRYAKRLRREKDFLLTFLRHDGVPYHNNASEQAVRIFAIMRKIFYGSRSIKGLATAEVRASVFATCEKRGINPFEFIVKYLRGDIDRIPAAAPKIAAASAA